MLPTVQNFSPFGQFKTWYRVVGRLEPAIDTPLVLVHGGPGGSSDWLEPLEKLATDTRPVIRYDQLGSGRSGCENDNSLWKMQTFIDQLIALLDDLSLPIVDLLGHSWGGWLSLQVALDHPDRVRRLVLASSSASVASFVEGVTPLLESLPPEMAASIARYKASGVEDTGYKEAYAEFNRRHVCRLPIWPEFMTQNESLFSAHVYNSMYGPNEFQATGSLKDWDVSDRLDEIKMPTLITSGRYDSATPTCQRQLVEGINGAKWEMFEHSAHVPHAEEEQRYLEVINEFLSL